MLTAHIGWNEYSCYTIKLKNRSFFRYLNSTDIKEIINCSDSSFNRGIKFFLETVIETAKTAKDKFSKVVDLTMEMDQTIIDLPCRTENAKK